MSLQIEAFFDAVTHTYSYVVADTDAKSCALIDPVMDYDPASGNISLDNADKMVDFVRANGLSVAWILETHMHADHLSAAPYLKQMLGGKIAIGEHIDEVQSTFGRLFNEDDSFATDGSQFDHLFTDGETFKVGNYEARVMHTPGHTPACVTYLIDDTAFVGDTLFMPDYGTARCDFPGGDAKALYRSIQKLYALPDETRVFMCHDYLPEGRSDFRYETTIGEEKRNNVHIHQGVSESEFAEVRESRDAKLQKPALIIPSVQVNMRAGHLPAAEGNGTQYLKIPLNRL